MIHDINVINTRTKESKRISDNAEYSLVLDVDETDWGTPAVSFSSYTIPMQYGITLTGTEIGDRKPNIVGYVIAKIDNEYASMITWEQFYSESLKSIESTKKELNKLFSPFNDVKIEITGSGYYLIGRPNPVKYGKAYNENNEIMCRFSVEIDCYNPLFQKESGKDIVMTTTTPAFRFPLIFKDKNVMGVISAQKSIIVENEGDCDIGGVIKLSALNGTVKNPKVFNIETEEYIKINVTLQENDYITINTNRGEEDVVIHRASTSEDISGIPDISEGSTFLQFKQGSFLYGYSVEEGTDVFVDVTMHLSEGLFNLEVS